MTENSNEPTVSSFVDWCKQQVEASEISSLLADYGYTDDNTDTIVAALQNNPDFMQDFGVLLRSNLAKDKSYFEESRSTGSVTADQWLGAAKASARPVLARATGTQQLQWWQVVLGVVGGAATAVTGMLGGSSTQTQTPEQIAAQAAAAKAEASKKTFLYIILGVVVLVVVVILWMSTKKK